MEKLLKVDKTRSELELLKTIKKSLSLKLNDELFLFSGKDYLVIKKVKSPSLLTRFNKLAQKVEKRFKEENIAENSIDAAVKWARK